MRPKKENTGRIQIVFQSEKNQIEISNRYSYLVKSIKILSTKFFFKKTNITYKVLHESYKAVTKTSIIFRTVVYF